MMRPICLPLLFLLAQTSFAAEEEKALETITVHGDRLMAEPGSTTVIREDQLETYKYTDLNRVLKTVPGVQVQEEDGFGLRPNIGMRGVAPHRSRKILFMEDGIPSGPAPYAAPAAYYVPSALLMEGIEVTKGPSAVRYGPQTIGGAINLLTKKIPEEPLKARIDLGQGSYGFKKAVGSIGGKQGPFSWMLLGSSLESKGYKDLANGGDTGFHKRDVLSKFSYDIGAGHSVFFKGGWTDELSDETYLGLSRPDFDADPYRRYTASERDQMKTGHRSFTLGHAWSDADSQSRLTIYSHGFDRRWARFDGLSDRSVDIRAVLANPIGQNQHAYDVLRGADDSLSDQDLIFQAINHRRYYSRGVDWQAQHAISLGEHSKNEWEWGVRVHQDAIRHIHSSKTFAMSGGRLEESGLADQTGAQDEISAQAVSAFVWDTYTTGPWSLSAGIRQEMVTIKEDDYSPANADGDATRSASMPGLGVFHQLYPDLGLLFGVYRGMGLAAADDDGSGKAEESINYEAGLRWIKGSRFLDVIGFWNDYRNLKGTCSIAEGCGNTNSDISYNGGKALIYGLEVNSSYTPRVASVYFPLSLQYTLTRASFQSHFTSALNDWGIGEVHKGDPLPYVPRHQLGIQAGIRWNVLLGNLQWKHQSESYDQAIPQNREKLPSSTLLDASFSYFASESIELYATADNLSNQKTLVSLRPFGARPGKPQSYALGLKASL